MGLKRAPIVKVYQNGVLVGAEPAINFIPGTNIVITTSDNSALNQLSAAIGFKTVITRIQSASVGVTTSASSIGLNLTSSPKNGNSLVLGFGGSNPTPAFVQVKSVASAGAVTSLAITLGSAPVNGNTLVLAAAGDGTHSNVISSISQTGATWVKDFGLGVNDSNTIDIWRASNVSGASTSVTLNLTTSVNISAVVQEFSGILIPSPLDLTTNNNANASTTADSGTVVASQAFEIAVAVFESTSGNYTFSNPTNGFTGLTQIEIGTAAESMATTYGIFTTKTNRDTQLTVSSSTNWLSAMAVYKCTFPAVTSITQTGASWTQILANLNTAGIHSTELWIASNVSGAGTTVIANINPGESAAIVVAEYSGITYGTPTDKTATNSGTSTSPNTGTTATTTKTTEVFIGYLTQTANATFSAPTNQFSIVAQQRSSDNVETGALVENIVTLEEAASCAVTSTASTAWQSAVATLKSF